MRQARLSHACPLFSRQVFILAANGNRFSRLASPSARLPARLMESPQCLAERDDDIIFFIGAVTLIERLI